MTLTYGSVCSGIEAISKMRWLGERILRWLENRDIIIIMDLIG